MSCNVERPLFCFLLPVSILCLACVALYVGVWIAAGRNQRTRMADLEPADVAVVLGMRYHLASGEVNRCAAGRVAAGVALYRAGKVRKLIMTGHNQAAEMARHAEALEVPPENIGSENASTSTYENLYHAARWIRKERLRSLVIVSDAYHLLRAGWLARRRFHARPIQLYPSIPHCNDKRHPFHILRETGAIIKNGLLGRYLPRKNP